MISSGASASGSGRAERQNQIVAQASAPATTNMLIETNLKETLKVTAIEPNENTTSCNIRLDDKLVGDE